MKKSILFASALLLTTLVLSGNEKYYENMGKTLQGFSTSRNVEDFQALANKFHIIAGVETEEWLPRYYEVQCYIMMTFVNGVTAEAKDQYLDQASPVLEELMEMAPDNAEVLTLQAFWNTSRLMVDPPSRSMNLQPLIAQSLGKALAIEPGHPRALFMRISNDMGTAAFFGSDTEPYCEQARELLANWDSYEPASPIHPSWGKRDVQRIVNRCGQ
jgi:hypothetical protein